MDTQQLLEKVNSGQITQAEAQKQIFKGIQEGFLTPDQAMELNQKIKSPKTRKFHYKVSVKGAISFYGLRRMPITLYLSELRKIAETYQSNEFQQFLTKHVAQIATSKSKTLNQKC